jgi:hypothetical protein
MVKKCGKPGNFDYPVQHKVRVCETKIIDGIKQLLTTNLNKNPNSTLYLSSTYSLDKRIKNAYQNCNTNCSTRRESKVFQIFKIGQRTI